jgi:hypothetical protein
VDNIDRLIKECYWDYHMTKDDVIKIAKGDDMYMKKHLFGKIIDNSTEKSRNLLALFSKYDLYILFNEFKIPSFNPKKVEKTLAILKYIIFNDNNEIRKYKIWKN